MIPQLDLSLFNLGKDSGRVGATDSARQTATVNHLVRAFFGPRADRREVQVLADEVGMGKTFVALAVAYTILSVLRNRGGTGDLDDAVNTYKCVLVITPGGAGSLTDKWAREDEAFLTRCSLDTQKTKWFRAQLCERSDELLQAIFRANDLRRTHQPVVLVAQANIFTKRLSDSAVRFLTACLFRWWGNGVQLRDRYHLIRGLSHTEGSAAWWDNARWAGAGEYEVELWDWKAHERFLVAGEPERDAWPDPGQRRLFARVGVTYEHMAIALDRLYREDGAARLDALRGRCKAVPRRVPGDARTTGYRAWVTWFSELKRELRDLFKALWPRLLDKCFPLVITDEAHHWRNNEAGDFRAVREFIAPYAKRLLMMTATPFQLNPQESINILKVMEHMERAIGADRVRKLTALRDEMAVRMTASAEAGRAFSREWGDLSGQLGRWDSTLADEALPAGLETDPRTRRIREIWSAVCASDVPLESVPGPVRPFFRRAIELRNANKALQGVMGVLVVRHRRDNGHRRYWVGREYPPGPGVLLRPDQSRLHLAPGQSLETHEELVQYLLMKVVAAASRGRHRTALGTALTGCYTTMWASSEGRKAIAAADEQRNLVKLLKRLTTGSGGAGDGEHPKLRRVVTHVMDLWDQGEKSLIFCFRVPTAEALLTAIAAEIQQRVATKRKALLRARGTKLTSAEAAEKAMQQFRRSLTAREASGVPLFIDRVLIGWLTHLGLLAPHLSREDVEAVAALASRAHFEGRVLFEDGKRPDRVFLSRAMEHVWAKRYTLNAWKSLADPRDAALTAALLERMQDESWITHRYGVVVPASSEANGGQETERAARSSLAAVYSLAEVADTARVRRLAREFLSRYKSWGGSVFESLTDGPNWTAPSSLLLDGMRTASRDVAQRIRAALFALSLGPEPTGPQWDFRSRQAAVDAMTRALLRDDLLLRMPTDVFREHDDTWAASLFDGMHRPIGKRPEAETLAQRVLAFLEELSRMSAKEQESYLRYTMRSSAQSVVLVKGETKDRDAVFSGFNTPLLPEILICTAVGQEGIDLHRECRHVIHYDLGWNPATIEQRTGRVDRLGSKTERERKLGGTGRTQEQELSGLDIALPYLAATYDERMFDVLRTRAQVFEILTGGDPTSDQGDGGEYSTGDEDPGEAYKALVPLPAEMLEDMRVELAVKTGRTALVGPT